MSQEMLAANYSIVKEHLVIVNNERKFVRGKTIASGMTLEEAYKKQRKVVAEHETKPGMVQLMTRYTVVMED